MLILNILCCFKFKSRQLFADIFLRAAIFVILIGCFQFFPVLPENIYIFKQILDTKTIARKDI